MGIQNLWQKYKDKGLEIIWVVSETETKEEIASWDWIQNFIDDKNATYPVVRDFKFTQVYGVMDPHSTSLPHQYILDGETMELVGTFGGKDPSAEQMIVDMLGEAEDPEQDCTDYEVPPKCKQVKECTDTGDCDGLDPCICGSCLSCN